MYSKQGQLSKKRKIQQKCGNVRASSTFRLKLHHRTNISNAFTVNKSHRELVSPLLQISVKDFSRFLEKYCSVKIPLNPSEAEGDIFKDSGTRTAILLSNFLNVTLLTKIQLTEARPAVCQQGAKFHSAHNDGFLYYIIYIV